MAGGCRGTVNEDPRVLNYVRDLVYAVSVIEIWAAVLPTEPSKSTIMP